MVMDNLKTLLGRLTQSCLTAMENLLFFSQVVNDEFFAKFP